MSKKRTPGKKTKSDFQLGREEVDELQMILDRLSVQDPGGESFERYLRSLETSLSGRPLLAAALVDKLSRNPNRTGFLTFQALVKIIENSPARRSLKQAAYRFSQKGFAAEKAPPPEKVVIIPGETRKAAAHLILVPGTMWIVSALLPEHTHGGYALISAFHEMDFETFNVKITEATQKVYRDYLQTLSSHSPVNRALEIPPSHAARLFFDMLDFTTSKDSSAEIERARELFGRILEPGTPPHVYKLMPEIPDPRSRFPEIGIEELLAGMDISWLMFGKNELAPYHEKIKALDSPLLVIPREVQVERSLQVLETAADELCVGKKRFLFRRFFEEQAMALKMLGEEEKALWAWTMALDAAGDLPASKNPAVYQMVIHSMDYYWPEDFTAASEARQKQAPQHQERRTESGIILP